MKNLLLAEIINKIIREDLGKIKKTAGRGMGTSQPYTIGSDRTGLGYMENEIPVKDKFEKVKVSRAFARN